MSGSGRYGGGMERQVKHGYGRTEGPNRDGSVSAYCLCGEGWRGLADAAYPLYGRPSGEVAREGVTEHLQALGLVPADA